MEHLKQIQGYSVAAEEYAVNIFILLWPLRCPYLSSPTVALLPELFRFAFKGNETLLA